MKKINEMVSNIFDKMSPAQAVYTIGVVAGSCGTVCVLCAGQMIKEVCKTFKEFKNESE